MKLENIRSDVRAFIDSKIDNGETVLVSWVAHQIVNERSGIEGDDADFYRACAYEIIAKVAKECVGKYAPKIQSDDQLVMDGFEYAQKAYPIERDGERVLVPTDQLSAEELDARADEYERMGRGCMKHAKELRYLAATMPAEDAA